MLTALTLTATLTAAGNAFGLPLPGASLAATPLPAIQAPSVQTPSVHAPSLPAVPPSTPSPPSLPAPGTPAPGSGTQGQGGPRQDAGGAAGSVADAIVRSGHALATGTSGASDRSGVVGDSSGTGYGADSESGSAGKRHAARRTARERRFRRSARRLAGCIGAVSGLARRVLILRAGLEGARPRSRAATAKKLGITVRRTAAAERRGLRNLRSANRSRGCGDSPTGSTRGSGFASTPEAPPTGLPGVPVLAALLGGGSAASSKGAPATAGAAPARGPSGGGGASPQVSASTLPSGEEGSGLPLALALAFVAAGLAAVALRPGWRVAHNALERRAEHSTERRQAELVASARRILGRYDR